MKKTIITTVLAGIMAISMSLSAFAGTWLSDGAGWWWQNNDGSYPANCWMWIDGNNDGISECYYFDENGYCLMNTVTPDGYYVNATGAWIVDGAIQQQAAANSVTNPSGSSGSSDAIFTGKTGHTTKSSSSSSSDDDDDDDDDNSSSSSKSSSSSSSSKTVSLADLNPTSRNYWGTFTNKRTSQDKLWSSGNTLGSYNAYAEFYTGGKYNTFSFTYAPKEGFNTSTIYTIEVYGDDDELLWESDDIDYKTSAQSESVDISGQDYVKIAVHRQAGNSWETILLKDAKFKK